jgi:hypothetical protein
MKYFTRLEKTLWICKLVENEKKTAKNYLQYIRTCAIIHIRFKALHFKVIK